MDKILCGSSCVRYILNELFIDSNNLDKNMKWITELALFLKFKGIKDISLLCYKSNLYSDYKDKDSIDINFEGFHYIQECEINGININETELTKIELLKELNENKYVILCVQSSLFNDKTLSGGHFIILNGLNSEKMVNVINPIKDKYEYRIETINNIIKYCKNYGSWRILIKGGSYD